MNLKSIETRCDQQERCDLEGFPVAMVSSDAMAAMEIESFPQGILRVRVNGVWYEHLRQLSPEMDRLQHEYHEQHWKNKAGS